MNSSIWAAVPGHAPANEAESHTVKATLGAANDGHDEVASHTAGEHGAVPVEQAPGPDAPERCPHCNEVIAAVYCGNCGEMRASARSYSMRELAAEAFETVTNADSRVWATVTLLFGRPGELTVAYMEGDRNAYVRPLQLFLFANIFYFVMASWLGMGSFQTPLEVHVFRTAHGPIALEMVRERLAEPGVRQREYVRVFDERAAVQAKTLIIVMVPIWAMLLAAVQLRHRAVMTKHIVFAMHFFAAMLVLMVAQELAIIRPLVAFTLRSGAPVADLDSIATTTSWAILSLYLAGALRVAYGESRTAAAAKGLGLALGFYLTLFVYRALLFFTVYWSL